MSARFLRPLTAKIILLTATSLAIVAGGFATLARKSAPLVASQPAPTRIKIRTTSKTVPLHEAQVMEASGLQATTAHPLSLAAADFDEDGTPDLIAGYENGGVGFISFSRGNVAAIYPDRNAAASALPFFAASQNTNLAAAPDFILTGDFDADGHVDVITAARGRTILSFLAGDGKGGFTEAQTMELNGSVTACEAGEINRADGLADFAVALNAPEGAQVQVFAAAAGAWKAQPQTYSLAQSATSMAFGHLTRAAYSDLAIAAGNELVLLEGGQAAATLTRKALSFRAESLVVGRFTDNSHDQLALAGRDGSLFVATHQITTKTSGRQSQRAGVRNDWQVNSYLSASTATRQESAPTRQLLRARVATSQHDNLLLLAGNQLDFVTNNEAPELSTASLEGQADLVAALPLRTSASALEGLILLSRDSATPLAVRPVPEAIFAVNSTGDGDDVTPGDGICNSSRTGAPVCSLRAAITEANATGGADTITFNIGTGAQTILLGSPLPAVTNPLVIDGTPQGGAPASQAIVISPNPNFTGGSFAMSLAGSNNTIRGLTITGFTSATAIGISASNNNVIEGTSLHDNGGSGIRLDQASNNLIGGTTVAARNVIYRQNADGISINFGTSTGNRILGNYIGTDSTGTKATLNNGNNNGVTIFLAANNIIGGTTAGARNIISGNHGAGISLNGFGGSLQTAADGNVIQGNYIGVDATGLGNLGNGFADSVFTESGILISVASNTTIGGTSPAASNVIANNASRGINIPTPSFTPELAPAVNNAILNNSIYSNGALGIDLGATGVTPNDVGDADTGSNNLQNFPVLTSGLTRTTGTTVTGTLNSVANATYSVELFSNAACDTSGNGEGETFVGRGNVTTNGSGTGSFVIVLTTPIAAGRYLTATVTDAAGNTSEFSACLLVQNAAADLSVTVTATPNSILVGNNVTYDIRVLNSGPDAASGVILTDNVTIPNGQFTLVSATPSSGTCTGTGPITCNLGTINPNNFALVRVIITPTIPTAGSPPPSVTATNTASASSIEVDSVPSNNSASASATVNAVADLAVTQTINPASPISGAVVTYTITITNSGPNTAPNVSATINPPVQLVNATCTAPAGWSCNRDGNPFFAFSTSLTPGSVVLTIRGTLSCLTQNTTLTSAVSVVSFITDPSVANNTSTLSSIGQAGTAVGTITYDAGGTALPLGPAVVGGTGTPPSGTFTLTNTGCLPMNLTTAFFARVTDAATLAGVDDSRNFSLRLIPITGAEIPLPTTPIADRNAAQPIALNRTLQPGQALRFRVLFNPPLPFFAGTFSVRNQTLFASQVLPDAFASQVRFNFITGGSTPTLTEAAGDPGAAFADITARVSPAIQIIARDGNPTTTPLVEMATVRDDFRVKVSLYDANKNATKITYQFFDTYRQPASSLLEVNLTPVLSALGTLLPGQPFTLQQDFTGASARPDITYVRVIVNDADGTTASASSSPFIPSLTAATSRFTTEAMISDVLKLAPIRLETKVAEKAQREN